MHTVIDSITNQGSPSGSPAFPIVGIGSSAGGLEAFTRLLGQLPVTTGMAYVVVQHLDPSQPSLLPGLLARVTQMPVREVQDGMTVEQDHIYVIPAHADTTLEQGAFTLVPRLQMSGPRLTINRLFESLAHERKQQAIGVLLSGTGSDGTMGLQVIKAEGGITFVQDEHSATFPQMPHHAIAAGCADRILSPEDIAHALARLSSHPYVAQQQPPATPSMPTEEEQSFSRILLLLRNQTGVDFPSYKPATLKRRISHRMAVLHLERMTEYATYLGEHSPEVEALYQDVLIPVTSFFRDPAAFAALTRLVFPEIVQHLAPGESIRIWVPGCSSGEEAYSLAICLCEFLEERSLTFPIQLFATDINRRAVVQARAGIYPAAALSALSPERLERCFTPLDRTRGLSHISKAIRERCVFALHNVAKDPPFPRLDLVSCRNVLMYLRSPLQRRVLQTFHYALKPHGFLLLGLAESAASLPRLFACLDTRQKVYAKKADGGVLPLSLMVSAETPAASNPREGDRPMPEETRKGFDVQQEADRVLLTNYTPASVVIDSDMEILHVRGHTSPYLEMAPGKASFNLLKMVRDDLALDVRVAIHTASKEHQAVTKEGLHMASVGTTRKVSVTVIPLNGPPADHYYLILFAEVHSLPTLPAAASANEQAGSTRGVAAHRVAALEQELASTRTEMRTMLEERDAANEELQAASEEILASNEELQSINEELNTANQQLQSSNEQLQAAHDYADAIIETIWEPLVVLDAEMRILRANYAFYQFFQTTPAETEQRFIFDLGNGQWNIAELRRLLSEILPQSQSFRGFEVDHTFPSLGHKLLLLSARRLSLKEQKKQWILLAFEDITEHELTKQKDDFIGIASHELKTPVTSLNAYAELLQLHLEQAGDQQASQLIAKMNRQLENLTSLMQELLDVTQIEAGQLRVRREWIDLPALVGEVVETLQHTTQAQTIVWEGAEAPPVYADPERISQVLTNVLANAIKYAPAANQILVKLASTPEEVSVSVQDGGPGIPAEQQSTLFKRFVRGGNAQEASSPGLGLGLYIAAQIIERHGGHIWVESQEGQGATFSFTLPSRPDSEGKQVVRPEPERLVVERGDSSDAGENPGSR